MKSLKILVLIAVALTFANSNLVFADLTPNEIVAQFNGLEGGAGWSFNTTLNATLGNSERLFSTTAGAVNGRTPLLSAYTSGAYGTSPNIAAFYTLCANPDLTIPYNTVTGYAKLNYNAATGATRNVSGDALTVGAAWLYSQYAQGTLAGFRYTSQGNIPGSNRYADAQLLHTTINLLMTGTAAQVNAAASTNKFVQALLQANSSAAYWTGTYNANQRYQEIGDFTVLVMNLTSGPNGTGTQYQDMLYVARAGYGTDPGGVPEPATLMLWTLGSLGVVGLGYCRKRAKQS